MTNRRQAIFATGMLMLGTLMLGCIPPTVTTLASGASKLASGNASELTGPEIQALIEAANAAIEDVDLDITSEQAEAVASFLSDNNINSEEDFTNLIEGVNNGTSDLEIDQAVVALFVQEFEPEITEELSNQGGGSLTSGLTKVVNSDMGSLTADELQILGTSLADLDIGGPQEDEQLSDDQAAAIVDFIGLNNIDTPADFENLDEENVQIPDGAEALFEGL